MNERRRWPIADHELFRKLLDEEVEPRVGDQKACALALGLKSQGHYSNLRAGKLRTIGVGTAQALGRLIPPRRWPELQLALLTPPVLEELDRYETWVEMAIQQYSRMLAAHVPANRPTEGEEDEVRRGVFLFSGVPRRLRRILLEDGGVRQVVQDFRETMHTRFPEEARRIQLSILHVLAPLVAADWTAVERAEAEFRPGELRHYFKLALDAEGILLRRPPARDRAIAATNARGPERDRRPSRGRGPRA